MPIVLRPYTRADKPAMLRRAAAFFGRMDGGRDSLTRQTLREWLKKPSEVYLIVRNGENAGFLCLGFRGSNVAWINYIYVDEAHRGQGIATAAIYAAERLVLSRKGYNALCMDVDPRSAAALRLYHRLGYDTLSMLTVRKNFGCGSKEESMHILGFEFQY